MPRPGPIGELSVARSRRRANNPWVDVIREDGLMSGTNLGKAGQNSRLRLASVMVLVGLLLAVGLVQVDAPRWTRGTIFVPFFMAVFCALQGLLRTCPGHVIHGTMEDDNGNVERVVRPEQRKKAKRLSRIIWIGASSIALVSTLAVVAIP